MVELVVPVAVVAIGLGNLALYGERIILNAEKLHAFIVTFIVTVISILILIIYVGVNLACLLIVTIIILEVVLVVMLLGVCVNVKTMTDFRQASHDYETETDTIVVFAFDVRFAKF